MQDNPSTPIGASIKDICKRHNISRSGLYNDIGAGKVSARKNGKRTIVDVASADAYYTSLPAAKIKPSSSDRKQSSIKPATKAPAAGKTNRGKRAAKQAPEDGISPPPANTSKQQPEAE